MRAYDQLCDRFREHHHLGGVAELLGWDQQTYLPAKGHARRAEQLAALAGLRHQRLTDPRVAGWIEAARAEVLTPLARRNLELMAWRQRRAAALPERLATDYARAAAAAWEAWRAARQADDFARFAPHLERVVALAQARGRCLAGGGDPYAGLLEEYEPGLDPATLECLLPPLAEGLVRLTRRVAAAPVQLSPAVLQGDFPEAGQWRLAHRLVVAMGFDLDGGRLDAAPHPFSSGSLGDVRLTTRLRRADLREGIGSILHEAGHGLYEQGLDPDLADLPVGQPLSMGLHESQSRLWENQVGRSLPGAAWLLGELRAVFPERFGAVTAEAVYRALNVVTPGLIRTEADELHYNLHICLRWELERRLIAGELEVAELPAAWRAAMERWLGIEVPNDRDGCLQDVHWTSDFGYFPTYALGNLVAAQLYGAAREQVAGLEGQIAAGELAPLRGWLRDQVHRAGSRLTQAELIQSITGQPLSERPLLESLEAKVGALYGLG